MSANGRIVSSAAAGAPSVVRAHGLATTRGAMHDMASSASRSRSANGHPKRKFPARSSSSPVNSVGDSSRESSECSGVTTPALVKLSRGLPAAEPAQMVRKKHKSGLMRNGASVYMSPQSEPLSESESPVSAKSAIRPAVKSTATLRSESAATSSSSQKTKKRKLQQNNRADGPDQTMQTESERILQRLKDGIDSNDTDTIFQILEESNVQVVKQTVNQLPVEFVSRLLEFLRKKICRKTVKTSDSLLWLEQLLQSKITFLLSLPGANKAMEPLSETLSTRIEVFDCVLKLKGRLNILAAQAQGLRRAVSVSGKDAVVEFEDSSNVRLDKREILESISGNQLTGMGKDWSREEVVDSDSDLDARTGDAQDSDCD